MNYDALFTNPNGRISRAEFLPALIIVLASIAFFSVIVTGRTAQFCVLVLLYPAFVLLAQRLHGMGYSAWLVVLPLALMLTRMVTQLDYISFGETLDNTLSWLALVVSAVFVLWGCTGQEKQ